MKINRKKILSACLSMLLAVSASTVMAQSVIFPQEKQPGLAAVVEENNVYTLSNDLFAAKFVKQDGKLLFGGCEELGLIEGTELFKVQLQGGEAVGASEMTLGEVRLVKLTGDAKAIKGSNRFDGQSIEADFTYGDL